MSIGSRRSTCLLYAIGGFPSSTSGDPSICTYNSPTCKREGIAAEMTQKDEGFWRKRRGASGVCRRLRRALAAQAVGDAVVLAGLDHRRQRRDLLALAQPHHDHAMRRAPEALDVLQR